MLDGPSELDPPDNGGDERKSKQRESNAERSRNQVIMVGRTVHAIEWTVLHSARTLTAQEQTSSLHLSWYVTLIRVPIPCGTTFYGPSMGRACI